MGVDILFVNPTIDWRQIKEVRKKLRVEVSIPVNESPSIGIGYLMSALSKCNYKSEYIDMAAMELDISDLVDYVKKVEPRLIGFTVLTVNVKQTAVISEILKRHFPSMPICVGGPHFSILPEETLEEFPIFDFGIRGEGEEVLPKVLENTDILHISHIRGVITRDKKDIGYDVIQNVEDLPPPDWSSFDLPLYPGNCPHGTFLELPLLASRGCPYECVFCSHALGRRVRRRSVESVVAEIRKDIDDYGCTSITFLDETFVCDLKWSYRLFDEMIRTEISKEITWSCSTRVNNCSEELFSKMRESGCYYVFFGLETGNSDTLKRIKKSATLQQARDAVKYAKKAGVIPAGSFIVGLPGDTEKEILETIEFAKELDLYSTTFPIATPFPGTELRAMAEKNEYGMRLLTSDWDFYSKQNCRALDSEDFPWNKMFELQQYAYGQIPKQNMVSYLRKITNPY